VTVSVLNKKLVSNYSPQAITLYQLTGGFIGLSILMPFYDYFMHSAIQYPKPFDWLWLFILACLCTVLTFILYIGALKKVSAFTVNLTLTMEPVYGIILAFIVFQENRYLSQYFYSGLALILIAVFLQMRRIVKQQSATLIPFE
jgi:drug/metabolite transporter (DMT)-like permease